MSVNEEALAHLGILRSLHKVLVYILNLYLIPRCGICNRLECPCFAGLRSLVWSSTVKLLPRLVLLINFFISFSFVAVQALYEFLNIRDGIGLCSSVSALLSVMKRRYKPRNSGPPGRAAADRPLR